MSHSDYSGQVIRALHLAARRHHKQFRKGADKTPYINHLIHVVDILINDGNETETDTLVAAALHDVLEDTVDTEAEREALRTHISQAFGPVALHIVEEVTDDKSLHKTEQRRLQVIHAPHLSLQAKKVKLSDKIANLTDIIHNPPRWWPRKFILDYIYWSAAVVNGLRGVNTHLEAVFDDTYHNALSKHGSGDGLFIVYAVINPATDLTGYTLHLNHRSAMVSLKEHTAGNTAGETNKETAVAKVKIAHELYQKMLLNNNFRIILSPDDFNKACIRC